MIDSLFTEMFQFFFSERLQYYTNNAHEGEIDVTESYYNVQ